MRNRANDRIFLDSELSLDRSGFNGLVRLGDLPTARQRGYDLLFAAGVLKIVLRQHLDYLHVGDNWARRLSDSLQGELVAIVVDVSALPHLSSRIIGGLVALSMATQELRQRPIMIVGTTYQEERVLKVLKLDHLFHVLQPHLPATQQAAG